MRSFSFGLLVITIAIATAVVPAQSLLVQQGQIVQFSGGSTANGDPVPGAVSGEIFGGTSGPDNPVMSDDGKVFFRGQILQAGGVVYPSTQAYLSRGYFYGDSRGNLVKILRGGEAEPSGTLTGVTLQTSTGGIGMTGGPRVASNGLMMFGASIWDVSGGSITTANDTALYVGTPGNFSILAREGDQAPGCFGATYTTGFSGMSQQPTCINAAGYVLFQSSLGAPAVTANNAAWFTGLYSNPQLMLRKGDLAPGGEVVSALGSLSQMNASGQVLTDVTFAAGTGTPPVTNANDKALWIYTPGGSIQQLVREGDPVTAAPGANIGNASNSWSYGTGSASFNDNGQFLLNTNLNGAVTANVNDRAMLILSVGSQTLVWRRGDLASGAQVATPGATFDAGSDASCAINNSGRIAFEGFLIGGGTTAANDTAIWTGTPGNLTMIAREGDVAPGAGGLLFGTMTGQSLLMNGSGQILFNNSLTGGNSSLWSWDPVLGLQLVELANDAVQVTPSLTHNASSQGGVQFTNGNSRPLSFANDGTASLRVGFSQGSSAIMTVRIGTLTGIPGKIPEAGGTHALYLNAGLAHAGMSYIVAGSTSTTPGTTIGAITVPLNIDGYTNFTLANINVLPYVNTAGALDAQGRAQAAVVLPPLPGFAGVVVYHAYGVLDGLGQLVFASEPARLEVTP